MLLKVPSELNSNRAKTDIEASYVPLTKKEISVVGNYLNKEDLIIAFTLPNKDVQYVFYSYETLSNLKNYKLRGKILGYSVMRKTSIAVYD